MSEILTIIARIEAKKEKLDLVKIEITKLIEPTLQEEGCMQYDLHQDNENPAHFIFFEKWESKELLQAHLSSSHMKNYVAATKDSVESFTINEMTHIG